MNRQFFRATGALLLAGVLAACATVGQDAPPEGGSLVWVAKQYTLGKQCSDTTYSAPTPSRELGEAGVEVVDEHVEPMMTCAACDVCPAYAARHFAQIRASGVEKARAAGFERSDPPARE